MKRILYLFFAASIAIGVNGQTGHFKQPVKKPAGTVKHNLNFVPSGPKSTLRTSSAKAQPYKSLSFSALPADPIVIRKGKVPVFIEQRVTPLKSATTVTIEDKLYRFLKEIKSVTLVENPEESFKIRDILTDEMGITHVKTVQLYKNVEVYGSESVFHFDAKKERFTGSLNRPSGEIDVQPKVSYSQTIELVNKDLEKTTVYRELTAKEKAFLKYDSPECKLMLFDKEDSKYVPAWMVSVRPNFIEEWQYVVDATDGSIIRKINNTKSDGPLTGTATDLNGVSRTIDVYLEEGTYYMMNISEPMFNSATQEGVIMTLNANNTSTANLDYSVISSANNTWTGFTAAVSAHYNANMAYDYFRTKFGRNSINGQGGNIISFINVTESDGSSMENAFWNGQAVFYGNGGSHFKSLSGALDVAAHELGHGVISNSANLEYIGQSGAINESFADIFGSMVDRDDWLMGEDVVKAAFYPSGALRDMSDPHNGGTSANIYWQPAHFSEMYLGNQDNGGVHINSGIVNKAFYLFATAVTKEKAERVYYKALTEYLTKTSQFIDLRIAVVEAAKDLYGDSSAEAAKAAEAFTEVGIYPDKPQTNEPDTYDTNPGQEYLLIYNTDDNFASTLYKSQVSGNQFEPLTSTLMKGKVSVTDDGSTAVFVDTDDRINKLSLDPPDQIILSEALFDNVAVSKDGLRLAAVSVEVDASIYVYDFGTEVWKQFTLYNPTTSEENINAGGVLYADAIEFDHTGQYIIYDAYNELNSSSAGDLSYWDVGFIKVWDNESNSFGDGTIFKLFTQLPENVSVGNPVFSKNSPDIIAFDYFYDDGFTTEYGIYGANLETGDLGLIFENNTLGYPSYSKDDSRIAFTYAETEIREDIYTIELMDDKINPAADPVWKIDYAKWPVYYATGERGLGLAPVANFTADYKSGSAPLQVKFVDLSTNDPTDWLWTFQGGSPSTSTAQNPEVTYNSNGTFRVTLKAMNSTGENTIDRSGYIIISDQTPVNEISDPAVIFYPNPVEDILQINYKGNFGVKIFSLSGKLLISESNEPSVDLSLLSSGVYILEIKTDSGILRDKLLKQ